MPRRSSSASRSSRRAPSRTRSNRVGTAQTGRRAAIVLRLAGALASAIEARELKDLYERFELPLVRVLWKMESAGIRIDREFLDTLGADLSKQCEALVHRIYAHAGE